MRVLLDGRLAGVRPTGIGRYVTELAGALAEGHDIDLHLVVGGPRHETPGIAAVDATTHVVDRAPTDPRAVPTLRRLAARLDADLVHHPHVTAAVGGRQPCIVTVHDAKHLAADAEVSSLSGPRRLAFEAVFRRSVGRADGVIAVSHATARALAPLRPASRRPVDVVHEGVATSLGPSTPDEVEALRARRGWSRPYVLMVGETRPHKNHRRLLDAWQASAATSTHDLVLVGRPHDAHGEVRAQISRLGLDSSVHVVTDLPDHELAAAYTGADLFVLPSLFEGFGLPILEAMACGTPVLTSTTTACAEVAGDAAELVDPHRTDEIRKALDRLLPDRDRLGQLARLGGARAATFTWAETAAGTVAAYEAVIGARP